MPRGFKYLDNLVPPYSVSGLLAFLVFKSRNLPIYLFIGSVENTLQTRLNPQPHTHSVQTSISSDDSETRPANITVNRFIKVN